MGKLLFFEFRVIIAFFGLFKKTKNENRCGFAENEVEQLQKYPQKKLTRLENLLEKKIYALRQKLAEIR